MFAHSAWPHDAVDMKLLSDPQTYERPVTNGKVAGVGWFRKQLDKKKLVSRSERGASSVDDFEFPKFKYLTASDASLKKSIEIIERTPRLRGSSKNGLSLKTIHCLITL